MTTSSRWQIFASGSVVHAAAGNIVTAIVAAPGATKRTRIFGFDIGLLETSAIRVRFALRSGAAGLFLGRGGVGGNQPSDHIYFGDDGLTLSGNVVLNLVTDAAAAATVHYVIRYITEG